MKKAFLLFGIIGAFAFTACEDEVLETGDVIGGDGDEGVDCGWELLAAGWDFDGDGIADYDWDGADDTDTDGDGIPDIIEELDADGDCIPDFMEGDAPGDGDDGGDEPGDDDGDGDGDGGVIIGDGDEDGDDGDGDDGDGDEDPCEGWLEDAILLPGYAYTYTAGAFGPTGIDTDGDGIPEIEILDYEGDEDGDCIPDVLEPYFV